MPWSETGVYFNVKTTTLPNAVLIIDSNRIGIYDKYNGWNAIWEHRW